MHGLAGVVQANSGHRKVTETAVSQGAARDEDPPTTVTALSLLNMKNIYMNLTKIFSEPPIPHKNPFLCPAAKNMKT